MATKKAEYYKYNQSGNVWDLYYFKTSADLIVETDTKKVLTSAERTQISDYLTTFNTANKLVQVESSGKIPVGVIPTLPVGVIPDLSNTYLTKTNPNFIGTLQGGSGLFNFISAYNSTNSMLQIGSRTQEPDSAHITFKDNQDGDGEMELYAAAGIKLLSNNSVIDVSNGLIRNLGTPLNAKDATTKEYVDNKVSSGFTTRSPVKAASISNIDITAVLNSLDGTTLSANDRVLLKNQTTTSQNGVYNLDSSKKPVKVDLDSALGSAVFVENGDTNNDYIFHCSTANTWVVFTKPDTIKPGTGLSKTGTTLSIASGGVTNAMLAGSIQAGKINLGAGISNISNAIGISSGAITNAMLDGSISQSKIADHTISDVEVGANTWSMLKNISDAISIPFRFGNIIDAIKFLRGTSDYNTSNTQTIAGAYSNAEAAQTAASNAMAAIPKITSGTSNPSTTGAKNGDLYFKELS